MGPDKRCVGDMATGIETSLADELRAICGQEGVIDSPDELIVYECDAFTIAKRTPSAVVFPTSTEQAARVLKVLHREAVPFVPRGAGTSLSGGCLPTDDAVFVCTSRMNRIIEIDVRNRLAHVEAGVVNIHVTDAVAADGYHFAPDPSSQPACTIGGNVATNSGGPHTLKYGVTVNHVLGLTLVTPAGRIVELGGKTEDCPGYDLLGVVVGSEGTLGLVTEAIVRLTRNPASYRTLLAVFESVDEASQSVSDIIAEGIIPVALEFMDRLMIRAVEDAHGFGLPRDAEAILIVELDGHEAGIDQTAERVARICRGHAARRVDRAASSEERTELWKCRKRAFGAIGRLSPSYCTQDGVVPRTRLPEMLRYVYEVGRKHDLQIANVFHAGDGNIHPILLFDERDQQQSRRVLAASHEILAKCVELGGTVTGEHGIGVEKTQAMRLMYDEQDLNAMRRLREIFDPDGLANPGKIMPQDDISQVKPMRQATH